MVMIGVDPHKRNHTAVAVNRGEEVLDRRLVGATCRQVGELLDWADTLEASRPRQQALALLTIGIGTDRVDHRLVTVNRSGGVGPLVTVNPDHQHGVLQCCWTWIRRDGHT